MSDPYVGKQLSARSFTMSEDVLTDYHTGLGLEPALGEMVPCMTLSDVEGGYFPEIAFPYQQGHLWMRQGWEMHGAVKAGETYHSAGEIEDIYVRRDRNVVQYRVDIRDSDGELVAVTRHHQSFLREALTSDNLEFRKPDSKPGARKFEIPAGTAFGGLKRTITKEMCGIFFHGDANYHTDDEAARRLSFERVVVGGRMTMSYVGAVLEEQFGARWSASGKLDLKFTNPVWCDDEVTTQGVLTGNDDAGGREVAFVWATKQDGTVVVVADASV